MFIESMKALYFDGKKAVYKEDLPLPQRRPGDSLIKVVVADICSTDKEILKGYRPDFKGVMGHEFCGIVEESPDPALVGKLVVGEINEGCGDCLYCRTGREKHCLLRQTLGMSRDGCFAEYLAMPTRLLHVVPEGLSPEKAVFTEPLAAAFEITEQVKIEPGMDVCVVGDGRLSLMIAQVLALTGAKLTVIGRHPEKLDMYKTFARTVLETEYRTESGGVKDLTADECFDVVVDATGSRSGIELSMALVRKMGTIVLKSTYAGKTELDLSLIPVGEISIVGSRCGPFEPALRLLSEGKVQFPPVELYELADWEKAFASAAFKAGFSFE